jgi:hypothetical protein
VINVCVSNNFVELQANEFCEKIQEHSLYKFIGVNRSEINYNQKDGNESGFIKTVILQDNDGTVYYVEPNSNGLKFAKQEITYAEYKRLQRKETINAFSGFFLIGGSFSAIMIAFVSYFS